MKLSIKSLVAVLNPSLIGSVEREQEITSIEFDSRKVKSGSAFFCLKGEKTDGHSFIKQVLQNGAALIVADQHEKPKVETTLAELNSKALVIYVEHVRQALAEAADLFYDKPSTKLKLIGVTGTNGKTTVTHLIAQVLSKNLKSKIGLIGTLGSKIFLNGECTEFWGEGSGRTTPEAPELQEQIAKMLEAGCTHVTMEVSSHSLHQRRVYACQFQTAVFTNLTQDHLDYHVTMENYFQSKAILFEMLQIKSEAANNSFKPCAIINSDSSWAKRFIERIGQSTELITYSIDKASDLKVTDYKMHLHGLEAKVQSRWGNGELELPLNGTFNLYNALAALAVALQQGISFENCLATLSEVTAAPGRFQLVSKPKTTLPTCIVDYAHTPDGLDNVLKTAKEIVPESGKLICVFGCGGDRDATKRPVMGKISTDYADFTYVTSDNPRTEDPNQIVADIMTGVASLDKVEVELDRATAIERAVTEADPSDIIVIAGKGHETYQIFADKTIHFDDLEEVSKVYAKLAQVTK